MRKIALAHALLGILATHPVDGRNFLTTPCAAEMIAPGGTDRVPVSVDRAELPARVIPVLDKKDAPVGFGWG
jgi:hypothetical protein